MSNPTVDDRLEWTLADNVEKAIEIERLSCEGRAAKELVDKQAEDAGLWFEARTAPEAYLQAALRQLHEIVEGKSPLECVQDLVSEEQKEIPHDRGSNQYANPDEDFPSPDKKVRS